MPAQVRAPIGTVAFARHVGERRVVQDVGREREEAIADPVQEEHGCRMKTQRCPGAFHPRSKIESCS